MMPSEGDGSPNEGRLSDRSPRDRERDRLSSLLDVNDAKVPRPGVLLADEIERCCKEFLLISPFSRNQLKAASYRLTVGDKYSLHGEQHTLSDAQEIAIPPFQVVVIQTMESLNLPRDMIARWNIKVSQAYAGLLWAGGPQVDPGYQGHLFCPIYNLSNTEVHLAYRAEVAVIDFVTTTAFTPTPDAKRFDRPPASLLLEDYRALESGLYKTLHELKDFELKLDKIEARVAAWGGGALTLIAIIIAALEVMVAGNGPFLKSLRLSDLVCLIASFVAVTLSCWVSIRTLGRSKDAGAATANSVVMLMTGIFLGVVVLFLALPLVGR
jgi:deoxycytidine triphosphate deaminase